MKNLREIVNTDSNADNAIHASIHPEDDTGKSGSGGGTYPNAIEESYIRRKGDFLYNEENKSFHQKLVNHYSNFTSEHKDNLKDYSEGSNFLNSYLWNKHNKTKMEPEVFDNVAKKKQFYNEQSSNLDKALKTHKTPEAFTVYSGTGHHPRRQVCLI